MLPLPLIFVFSSLIEVKPEAAYAAGFSIWLDCSEAGEGEKCRPRALTEKERHGPKQLLLRSLEFESTTNAEWVQVKSSGSDRHCVRPERLPLHPGIRHEFVRAGPP